MASTAALKLNLPKRSDKYWELPAYLLGAKIPKKDGNGENVITQDGEIVMRGYRFSELRLAGEVFSYSKLKDDPSARCDRSFTDFQREAELSRRTVADGLKTHKETSLIKQTKFYHKNAEYTFEGKKGEGVFHITVEKYLEKQEFYIPRQNRTRTLENVEVLLVSLLGAHCNKPKAKGCDFSVAELSEQTGYCESEVREGIKCLISAGFITVSGTFDYIHLKTRRRFYVNKDVRLLMIHSPRRKKEEREKTYEEKSAEDAEARGEFERHYSQNHESALDRAEKNRKKANENADFKEADEAMRECEIELARAEKYGTEEKVKTLSQTLAEIKERRRTALKAVGIKESDLLPQWTCKKCKDTGYLPDDSMCDCYTLSRGSP